MKLIKNTINICETAAKGSAQAMADGDVIVPDTKPDILKLLQVDAEASVTDKYIENGRLNINGRVDCKILYIPESANERIKSILTSMEFHHTADAGGAEPTEAKMITAAAVERVEFSAVNSRKIRLRAIVSVDYEVCEVCETELCCDTEEEAEKRKKTVTLENTVDISEHEFTVKESLEVPSGQSSIHELLKADVRITDTEYKTVTGKLIVKGCAGICILYTDDEGELKYIEAEIPFTEVFDMEGCCEDTICDIDFYVAGVMCEAVEDNDGDMRVAEVDIDITASLRGVEMTDIEVLEDCFIPYMNTVCEREKLTVSETVQRPAVQNTIREIIDFPSNAPAVMGVYNVMTDAVITKAELQRNKLICEGRIDAYILYLAESEESPVYSIKKDIKFSYMIDCEPVNSPVQIDARAVVKHISYNLNSGGDLELRCILAIDAKLIRKIEISNITDIITEEKEKRSGIIIYFTKNGESVWDVAKKYRVTQDEIKRFNSVEDDRLNAGTKLFIPSC